jgi:hypothetical protein
VGTGDLRGDPMEDSSSSFERGEWEEAGKKEKKGRKERREGGRRKQIIVMEKEIMNNGIARSYQEGTPETYH